MAIRVKTVHRLKVTLLQVKPPVWRRIEVASNIKLAELSGVLEAAMGWLGGHLHAFKADGVLYEIPDDDSFGVPPPRDERKARLGDVLPVVTSKMRWDYDFGDGWEHDVVVESIEPMSARAPLPCASRANAPVRPTTVVGRGATATFWQRSVTRPTRNTRRSVSGCRPASTPTSSTSLWPPR
jgi:Plasmid pRiA4b ORF-3-like protein